MQTIIDKIISLLEDNIGEIKEYYQGDPVAIPAANLPCIFVEGISSDISAGATGIDEVLHTIIIGVVFDKRQELNRNANENVKHRKLIELTQNRDSDGNFEDNTIVGILRTNFTLSDSADDQNLSVAYGIAEREGILTAEARVTVRILELVTVSTRT